jgi:hypothetical protein
MTNINLGGFFPGKVAFRSETLSSIKRDSYAFSTTGASNMAISASSPNKIFLSLFRDNDANGVANIGDTPITSTNGGTFQVINSNLPGGNYVARVVSNFNTGYNIRVERAVGEANPLANKEIQLGTIAKDMRRRNRVDDNDTADNFAFTLDGDSSLDIKVRELGKQKGDVNIRVVQDRNSNGEVDRGEVVVKGISTNNSNLDTISGLKGAGDYILQVCQTEGNTRFAVKFDHSVA